MLAASLKLSVLVHDTYRVLTPRTVCVIDDDGAAMGAEVGTSDGLAVGFLGGPAVGVFDSASIGLTVGFLEGSAVGEVVGVVVGSTMVGVTAIQLKRECK